MTALTLTEALDVLNGALPENPDHDRGSVAVPTDAIRALVDPVYRYRVDATEDTSGE